MLSAPVPRNLRVRASVQLGGTRVPARAFLTCAGLLFAGGLLVVAGADLLRGLGEFLAHRRHDPHVLNARGEERAVAQGLGHFRPIGRAQARADDGLARDAIDGGLPGRGENGGHRIYSMETTCSVLKPRAP